MLYDGVELGLRERLEESPELLRRHPDAGVGDGEGDVGDLGFGCWVLGDEVGTRVRVVRCVVRVGNKGLVVEGARAGYGRGLTGSDVGVTGQVGVVTRRYGMLETCP